MECSICYETDFYFIQTYCNHIFCVNCISKIKFCALCQQELITSKLCKEIKSSVPLYVNNQQTDVPLDFWFSGSGNRNLAIPMFLLSYPKDENYYSD